MLYKKYRYKMTQRFFIKVIAELDEGVKVNRVTVNNLRYADDTVLIVGNAEDFVSNRQKFVKNMD